MLNFTGNDMAALFLIHCGHAFESEIVGFGSPTSKNDFFGISIDQRGHLSTALIHSLLSPPSKGVISTGCIAKICQKVGLHGL